MQNEKAEGMAINVYKRGVTKEGDDDVAAQQGDHSVRDSGLASPSPLFGEFAICNFAQLFANSYFAIFADKVLCFISPVLTVPNYRNLRIPTE